ncbi:hypothetical protein GCM10011444_11960 [Winogradskyella haliclonae]|uniref:VanZ-like domain-containing protein n=1 Tax=Winogradskyella haliclonae TaxID=2048558 RepID=A0ABQ2BYK9_9FLAO|nr:hypothetical protein GCM10011444_11960 [Winogradskyella haliclonae]
MFNWFELFGFSSIVLKLRESIFPLYENLPSWIYYSLPDGLWVYSFSSAHILIWGNSFSKLKFWLLIPVFCGVGAELLQFLNLLPGTFDIYDFIFSIMASSLSIFFLNPKFKYYER